MLESLKTGGWLGLLVFRLFFLCFQLCSVSFSLFVLVVPHTTGEGGGGGTVGGMTWIGRFVVGGLSIKVVLFCVTEHECIG